MTSGMLLPLALVAGAVLVAFAALWVASLALDDVSVVDGLWGPAFVLAAWLAYALAPAHPGKSLVPVLLVTVWGTRLGVHLVARHARLEREDARYAAMRARHGPAFRYTSLVIVFLLQAAILLAIATPVLAAALLPAATATGGLVWAGVALFAVGFVIEAVADGQLARFRRDPAHRGRTLTGGLWAWSRHPNYFGEIVLWWGLGLVGVGLTGAWWVLAGPALLTVLLLKVSGVPLLDAHMAATRPDWADYAARTPALVPWPPRPELKAPVASPRRGP